MHWNSQKRRNGKLLNKKYSRRFSSCIGTDKGSFPEMHHPRSIAGGFPLALERNGRRTPHGTFLRSIAGGFPLALELDQGAERVSGDNGKYGRRKSSCI